MLYLDGVARTAPFTYDTLIGFTHTIDARDQTVGGNDYTFSAWSDGGAKTHTVTVPATAQSYTATYTATPAAPKGLAAAWGFNEVSGATTTDTSGNNNTATLLNGLGRVAGKYGSGLSFDGVNDYLTAASSTSLDIAGNGLTLSMWLKPAGGSGDQVLVGKHWNTSMTSPYYQYGLELQSGATTPVFEVGTTGGVLSAAMGSALTDRPVEPLGRRLQRHDGAVLSDPERRRQEPFLDVVPDRAAGNATEVRQVADRVAGFLGHVSTYTTVTVTLSTVILARRFPAEIGGCRLAEGWVQPNWLNRY